MTDKERALVRACTIVLRQTPDEIVLAAGPTPERDQLWSAFRMVLFSALFGLVAVLWCSGGEEPSREYRGFCLLVSLLIYPLSFAVDRARHRRVRWCESVTLRRGAGVAEITIDGYRGTLPFRDFSFVDSGTKAPFINVGGRSLEGYGYPTTDEMNKVLAVLQAFCQAPPEAHQNSAEDRDSSIWRARGQDLARLFLVVGADDGGISLLCERPGIFWFLLGALVFGCWPLASVALLDFRALSVASCAACLAVPFVYFWRARNSHALLRLSRDGDTWLQATPTSEVIHQPLSKAILAFESRDGGDTEYFFYRHESSEFRVLGGDPRKPEETLALLHGIADRRSRPYR